jgi:hypothetical protein
MSTIVQRSPPLGVVDAMDDRIRKPLITARPLSCAA